MKFSEMICVIAKDTTMLLSYAALPRGNTHIHELRHPSGYFYHTFRKHNIHSLQLQTNIAKLTPEIASFNIRKALT